MGAGSLGVASRRLHAWLVPRHGDVALLPPWRTRFPGVPSPPESWPAAAHAASVPRAVRRPAGLRARRPAATSACSACSSNLSISRRKRLDFLGHVAIAHRLVTRGVLPHLGTVGRQVPQLDHAQRHGQSQHFQEQVPKCRQSGSARGITDRAEVRRIVAAATMARKARLRGSHAAAVHLAARADPNRRRRRQKGSRHHGHVERRLAARSSQE